MEHTGHVMLVGEGAERFAVAQGFPRENLLTEHSRKIWLLWKETHSDWWGPGLASPDWHKRLPAAPHADDFERRIERMKQLAARYRNRAGAAHAWPSARSCFRPPAPFIVRR